MKLRILTLVLLAMTLLTACGSKKEEIATNKTRIGLVLSIGGLGDKSFNDSAYAGLMATAEENKDIEVRFLEPGTLADEGAFIEEFVAEGFDFIIGTGFTQRDSIKKAAMENPEISFAIIDSFVDEPNVASLIFDEEEGSFLAGALAAMKSETGKVGFVGGMELPLIKRFERGYTKGAQYVNEDIEVFSAYTSGNNPFNDPVQGKESALSMIGQGADVLYHAAGGTGIGVIQGAKEAGVMAIGVDSDQSDVAPGTVIASMLKRVDIAVYTVLKEYLAGEFVGGESNFNLSNGGVGLTELSEETIGVDTIKRIEEVKKELIK